MTHWAGKAAFNPDLAPHIAFRKKRVRDYYGQIRPSLDVLRSIIGRRSLFDLLLHLDTSDEPALKEFS